MNISQLNSQEIEKIKDLQRFISQLNSQPQNTKEEIHNFFLLLEDFSLKGGIPDETRCNYCGFFMGADEYFINFDKFKILFPISSDLLKSYFESIGFENIIKERDKVIHFEIQHTFYFRFSKIKDLLLQCAQMLNIEVLKKCDFASILKLVKIGNKLKKKICEEICNYVGFNGPKGFSDFFLTTENLKDSNFNFLITLISIKYPEKIKEWNANKKIQEIINKELNPIFFEKWEGLLNSIDQSKSSYCRIINEKESIFLGKVRNQLEEKRLTLKKSSQKKHFKKNIKVLQQSPNGNHIQTQNSNNTFSNHIEGFANINASMAKHMLNSSAIPNHQMSANSACNLPGNLTLSNQNSPQFPMPSNKNNQEQPKDFIEINDGADLNVCDWFSQEEEVEEENQQFFTNLIPGDNNYDNF